MAPLVPVHMMAGGKYALLRHRSTFVVAGRQANTCMKAADEYVSVGVAMSGATHTSGVKRCGNVWSCPVCAPVIRSRRALEVDDALSRWQSRGGQVMFVTVTVPHRRSDSLQDSLDRLTGMWAKLWKHQRVMRSRKRSGVAGIIRSIEVTHGRNGWHPHIHALVLLEDPGMLGLDLADSWRYLFAKAGLQYVPHVSIDFRSATAGTDVAGYVAGSDSWSLGAELAKADRKSATPFGILRASAAGHGWAHRLWAEWERTMKGRRALQWTPGLRALLGMCDELTDQELLEVEPDEPLRFEYLVPSAMWERHRRAGSLPVLYLALQVGQPPPGVLLASSRLVAV